MAKRTILPKPPPELARQLCTRRQSAHILSVSYGTIRRLEKAGVIEVVRPRPNSNVRHRIDQIHQIAAGRK
jgi:hypothetical protein